MTEREAFEGWLDKRGEGLKLRWIGQDGSVPVPVDFPEHGSMANLVRGCWEGWQASAARYEGVVEAARAFTEAIDVWNNSEPSLGGNPDRVAVGKAEFALRQALAALDGAK